MEALQEGIDLLLDACGHLHLSDQSYVSCTSQTRFTLNDKSGGNVDIGGSEVGVDTLPCSPL